MSIYDAIEAGEFKTKLEYPSRPKMPEVLRKRGSDMTAEERLSLQCVSDEYEKSKAAYEEAIKKYRADEARLAVLFEESLAREFLTIGHQKHEAVFDLAYERGHSYGLREVAMEYERFAELVT